MLSAALVANGLVEPGVLVVGEPPPVVVGLESLPRLLAVVGVEEDEFTEQHPAGGAMAALEEGLDPRPPPGFPDGLEAVADLVDPSGLGVGQAVEIRRPGPPAVNHRSAPLSRSCG